MLSCSVSSPHQVDARVLPSETLLDLVRGVVEAGGGVWIRVTGISMNPVLREGDSVLLARLARPPRRGDVLFVDARGTPLLHRVTQRDAHTVVTRGDAARTEDAPVSLVACAAQALAVRRGTALVALTPTLQFGLKALVWYAAWRMRARLPEWVFRKAKPLSRAIVRALS